MFLYGNYKRLATNSLFWLGVLVVMVHVFYYPKFNKQGTESTLSWDVAGYYAYLPALFIYKDIKHLTATKQAVVNHQCQGGDFYCAFALSNGNQLMKYWMGNAVLMLPFFAMAHAWALSSSYIADGFSFPYQFSIAMGCLVYFLISIFLLQKLLANYFSLRVVAISLWLLVFATNLLEYGVISGGLVHNQLFFVYSLILFFTHRFYNYYTLKDFLIISGLVGLAVLIRPTEVIVLVIPMCWGVSNWKSLRQRIIFFATKIKYLLYGIVVFGIIVMLQFLYWKWVSGQWLIYTYGDQTFDWARPHIVKGLFSIKKGWFVYTPIMLAACVGFYFLYKKYKEISVALMVFMILTVYVVFSWSIWWYATSLGQRAMVQSYAIMVFPLAAFVQWLVALPQLPRYGLWLLMGGCLYLNGVYTWQAHYAIYFEGENMTKAFFWRTCGKPIIATNDLKLLDTDEDYTSKPINPKTIFENEKIKYTASPICPYVTLASLAAVPSYGQWIRVSALFEAPAKEWNWWVMPQLLVTCMDADNRHIVKQRLIRVSRLMPMEAKPCNIYMDIKIPQAAKGQVLVQLYNGGGKNEITARQIKVIGFE